MKKINLVFAVAFVFLIFSTMLSIPVLLVISTAAADSTDMQTRIWTDKADYSPGQKVTIYGENFLPNGTVKLSCTKLKDGTITQWSTTCDSLGNFTTTYQIDKIGAPLFNIAATDGTNAATSKFTAFLLVTNSLYSDSYPVTSSKGTTDSDLSTNLGTSLPSSQCGITEGSRI